MTSKTRATSSARSAKAAPRPTAAAHPSGTGGRSAAATAARRPAPGRPGGPTPKQTRRRWLPAVGAVAAILAVAGGVFAATRSDEGDGTGAAAPYVGGDLHVMASIGERVYVGGHDGGAVSADGASTWTALESLRGADPMGWGQTTDAMLVGGHPGLFRSTDDGATFAPVTGEASVPDVHALGAAGDTAYAASTQAGLLTSTDGGTTWQVVNPQAGQGFMGTILVDPADPQRLVAPDMAQGLVTSIDGGLSWTPLGGPGGAMAAAWNPTNTDQILAVGMGASALSTDGGATWTPVEVPQGATAATFTDDGRTLYAGVLEGTTARTYASTDLGETWSEV